MADFAQTECGLCAVIPLLLFANSSVTVCIDPLFHCCMLIESSVMGLYDEITAAVHCEVFINRVVTDE